MVLKNGVPTGQRQQPHQWGTSQKCTLSGPMLGMQPGNVCPSKASGGLGCTVKSENHRGTHSPIKGLRAASTQSLRLTMDLALD